MLNDATGLAQLKAMRAEEIKKWNKLTPGSLRSFHVVSSCIFRQFLKFADQ